MVCRGPTLAGVLALGAVACAPLVAGDAASAGGGDGAHQGSGGAGGGGGAHQGSGGAGHGAGGTRPGSDVVGTVIDTRVTDTGSSDSPELVTLSARAGDVVVHGAVQADGSFTLHDVPEGVFTLAVDGYDEFVVTAARHLDLGAVVLGRVDALGRAQTFPSIRFDVSNLAPWQPEDEAEIWSVGGDVWASIGFFAMPAIPEGATIISSTEVTPGGLADTTKGDKVWVTDLPSRRVGGAFVNELARTLSPASFVMQDGGATPLAGAFVDTPQTERATLACDAAAFLAQAPGLLPPEVSGAFVTAEIHAEPAGPNRSSGGVGGSVVQVIELSSAVDVSFGDPFPASWPLVLTVRASFMAGMPFPDGQEVMHVFDEASRSVLLASADGAVVEPEVGPVTDVLVGGMPATAMPTGVGTTPTVSWSPPALGTPTLYTIQVFRREQGFLLPTATIATDQTSVELPAGVLRMGAFYSLQISASVGPTIAAPFRVPLPSASASATTPGFSP